MRSQSPTWRLETPSKSATSWRVRPSAIHSRAESRWKMRRSPICRRRCSISWRCLALNTMVFIAHRPAAGVGHIRVLDRSSTKIIGGKTRTTRLYHKAWDGSAWRDWEPLGGVFNSAPAVAAWGTNRLDIFALGTTNVMYHKAWDGSAWRPSLTDWEPL